MGFLDKALGFAGNLLGFESGIGDSVPQVGHGPWKFAQKQYRASEQGFRDAIQSIDQGYASAQSRAGDLGAANAQLIADRGAQAGGSLLGRLMSSGMTNTSVAPNMARGIAADQNRNLLLNNELVAQQRIGLDVGAGQARAGAQGQLALSMVNRAENARSFFLNREGLRLDRDKFVSESRQNRAGLIGDTAGSLAGLAFGG